MVANIGWIQLIVYKVRAFDDDPSSRLMVIYIISCQKLVDHLDMLYKKGGCSHSAFFHNARNLLIIWTCCAKKKGGGVPQCQKLVECWSMWFFISTEKWEILYRETEIVTLNFKHGSRKFDFRSFRLNPNGPIWNKYFWNEIHKCLSFQNVFDRF